VSQVVQVLDLPQLGAFMRTRREDLDRKRHDRLPADAVTYCRLFHMGSGRQSRERMGALPPGYSFVLNPYTSERFTKCPSCETPTRIRKLPLVIHVERDCWLTACRPLNSRSRRCG
jgi:hypothetical protein